MVALSVPLILYKGLFSVFVIPVFLVAVLVVLGLAISRFNAHKYLYLLVAFVLPLGVEVEIVEGIKLLVPGEPLLALLAIVIFFDFSLNKRKVSTSNHTVRLLMVLVAWLVFSALFSSFWIVSLKYIAVYILYIFVFINLFWQQKNASPKLFEQSMLFYTLGYLCAFAWSIYHWSTYGFNPVTIPKIFEPFYADHTIFGASGAFLIIFWTGQFWRYSTFKMRVWIGFMLLFCMMAVRVSNSRAAILSIPVAMLVFAVLRMGITKRHLAIGFVVLAVLGTVFQSKVVEAFQYNDYNSRDEHASLVERTASVTNVQTDVSNLERINRWVAAKNMLLERPLTGFGPGTFQYAYIPYQEPRFMNRLSVKNAYHIPTNSGGTVHSEPLLFASEMGVMGLLIWVLLMGSMLWKAFSMKGFDNQIVMVISIAMLSTYLFHGFFNNFLNTDKFAFLFWGSTGFFISSYIHEFKRQQVL